jgi:hypothetical protein
MANMTCKHRGKDIMIELPFGLEIEFLSDSELMDKITEVLEIIKMKKSMQDDDQDEQELYEELETERIRRYDKSSMHN